MLKLVLCVVFPFVFVAHCQLTPINSEKDHKERDREFILPNIPKSLENSEYGTSRFVFIWANRLHHQNQSGTQLRDDDPSRPEPAIILIPSEFHMLNLVPQDAPHPLYSSRYTELTEDFLLDSMSTESVDPADNRMATPEGLTVKTRIGKDLIFKKDPKTNVLSVNGITIEDVQPIAGSHPKLIILDMDGFLFDYRQKIDDAFQILARDAANHPNHPLSRPKPQALTAGGSETSQQ